MTEAGRAAFITGGASGIGRAVVHMLVSKGAKVYIADRDIKGAEELANSLNATKPGTAAYGQADVSDWHQQVTLFDKAIKEFGRIDYVYPIAGIGERAWLPKSAESSGWIRPDFTVLDVDLTGALYTVALAVQHFRRQELSGTGFRGKIFCVASICGFYAIPTLPIYTAAKHAIVGFVRCYGKLLVDENITINAICPNVVRTSISTNDFYDSLEARGYLTPMSDLTGVFESLLGSDGRSGLIFECGPNGPNVRDVAEYVDEDSQVLGDLLLERARPLHQT